MARYILAIVVLVALAQLSVAEDSCVSKTTCGECTTSLSCVWCPGDHTCKSGTPFGGCSGYKWRQCSMSGALALTLVIIGVSAFLLIVIILAVGFICCCCCGKKLRFFSRNDAREARLQAEWERQELLGGTTHPKTDELRQQMRAKYGDKISANSNV
mmetsp:Transcript_53061/g.133408  ORF Transcript_53061/g.133408 Transcript_53061/m.133408 type:complete len:157 (+) Transcript_53061:61-531(+)|eukprot:CAMPEP_0177668332 /NCGR_PEP_ID=MMETSP0447-20121125/22700_1 /TAXON_ID=0 /ORGANISM="Stygamoeba regulata, Strain BSH-02190019" /LENGTH=156 /DNA_ID=CAMNT_0019174823 /DNA_START=60 /DNA_END=530 /DNA_ORIENTATION=+